MSIKSTKTLYQNTAGISLRELVNWANQFTEDDENDGDVLLCAGFENEQGDEFDLVKIEYLRDTIYLYFENLVPNYETKADGLCPNCFSDNLIYKDADTLFQKKVLCKDCGKIF